MSEAEFNIRIKKRVLVTGAANGLGRAIALQLSEMGFEVVAVDRDETGLLELHQQSIETVIGIHGDFSHAAALESLVDKIAARGPFELVFLVAGISATGAFEMIPRKNHEKVLTVNAIAPMVIANRLAARKGLLPGSSLMFVSSLSHAIGYPGAASYAASKDAVAVYARSIRRPYRKLGIKVCCTFPGPIRTDHAARHAPADSDETLRMPVDKMAKKIIQAAIKGKTNHYPGAFSKIAGVAGRVFPNWATKKVRKAVLSVWMGPSTENMQLPPLFLCLLLIKAAHVKRSSQANIKSN